ncbi:MAG: hypothetical protein OZSIB_0083 [Candidatus Ozemobacter sibiricus]|jgi:putative Mn2+ efflux pump MntP|uniref:Putative manganese efflux pump MntP n=1 Tax=Candidatus Ozemobacter sibiricus TaxID=2268124 RepID=A0A367ZMU9_9BACT|nr:MAG: hypothetical protein OZSIB_0083 [Candidatus Ozemobacter sibiricus]
MNLDSSLMVLGIALALGCDAFAVGLAIGTRDPDRRQCFRLWFHFGLFQFLMTMGGWYAGRAVLAYIADYDHWIASGLLAVIALRMLKESLADPDDEAAAAERCDPTRGWSLVALSFATSFDALGVGFGMSMAAASLFWESVVIGFTAAGMTWTGLFLGRRLSIAFGKRVETMGALILLAIAAKLLEI